MICSVPNLAQCSQTERQDHVTSFDNPRHARRFESLREHGLAGCLRYAATNGKTHAVVGTVLHVVLVPVKVVARFLVSFLFFRGEHPFAMVFRCRVENTKHSIRLVF